MAGPIPAAAFYGSSGRRSDPLAAQLEVTAARLQRTSVCRPPRPSLLGPAATWRVFPRQAAALQAAAASPGLRLMVFGCEERVPGGGGRRSYLVCHPSVFWQCDRQKRPDERCSYEVIRQGAPCKLYLDLEFDRTLNPDRDGDAMVELFLAVIAAVVEHLFEVKCSRRDVIDLCSSSEKKFSRHLIFCHKDLVFCDNITVGNLVRDICDAIRSYVLEEKTEELSRLGLQKFSREELIQLLVNSNNANSLFCDEGVYTKNRNFRVYKSSKFGKRRSLIKSVHNAYSSPAKSSRSSGVDSSEEAFFLASLVSHIEGSTLPLKYGVPSCREDSSGCPTTAGRQTGAGRLQNAAAGASPYPDIDAFVRDLVSPGGVRCWHYFDGSELLVYDIVGFRFCHNIGRWHRSNNIIIVVSLRDGSFYQKCHDPACRGFRSDSLPLPGRLLAWRDLGDDWEAAGGDDGRERGDQFPDCGASDTEMLSAAALTELESDGGPARLVQRQEMACAAASVKIIQPRILSPCTGADIGPNPTQATAEVTPPDLFPDCGVEDEELASVPTGACVSQHRCDGRATSPPAADPAPDGDGPFPDCGVEDSEMVEEVSTEPLPNCGDGDGDDQSTESMPIEDLGDDRDFGTDSFPDCGVGDAELPAVPCSGREGRGPADATGREVSDVPVEAFPDCGVCDWELSEPAQSPGRGQELFPDWDLPSGPADLFPDCGVGDWELCEVGRSASATAVPADTPAAANPACTSVSAHTADTATGVHTVHTPDAGNDSDQLYYTAKTSSSSSVVWDDLTEADLSDLQF